MKLIAVALAAGVALLGLMLGSAASPRPVQEKQPDVLQLAAEARIGAVTFSHTNHTTKNYNITGTGLIACIECHHTDQPAAEVAKHPPLKTAWPVDRTTTLTAESLKDSKDMDVVGCRSCHARAGAKPQVWPEIPQIKYEGGTAMISLTNQQAFHRNCAGCHDEAIKARPAVKAPRTQQCTVCHTRKAA